MAPKYKREKTTSAQRCSKKLIMKRARNAKRNPKETRPALTELTNEQQESPPVHMGNPEEPSTSVKNQAMLELSSIASSTAAVTTPQMNITGRRIVNIGNFFQEVVSFQHLPIFSCNNSHLQIVKEQRKGFLSNFLVKCSMCLATKIISSDPKPTNVDVNTAAVVGTVATGGGYSQLQEVFGYCDIPVMSGKFFQKIQNNVADSIHEVAWKLISAAGKEERKLAIDRGDIDDDGYPFIVVIADGAWSKRSYKVNYDAASGVGAIIGKITGKLLFLAVRNKYCCICKFYENKNVPVKNHSCSKNWDGTSTSMESDVIVEGFCKSIEMHGLKYQYLVGDGDSSVTKKLNNARPYPQPVHKIECRNHLLRNYCNKLRELSIRRISSKQRLVTVQERRILANNIKRLRSGIVAAVKWTNAQDLQHSEKILKLKNDIYNCPNHVFGDHDHCSVYFCSGVKDNEENWVPKMKESGLFDDIFSVTDRIARNSESLLINMDTNAAELYNSLVAKFVGGKRINFSSRRSYTMRCEAAAISYNAPAGEFAAELYKHISQNDPGKFTSKIVQSRKRQRQCLQKQRAANSIHRKRKVVIKPMDEDYGEPENVMTEEEFENEKKIFLEGLSKTAEEAEILQVDTIGTVLWKEERRKRITASHFGAICKMRQTTHCKNVVKSILYDTFCGSVATMWGQDHEKIAIREYESINKQEVKQCGLFVDLEKPYLGATPDGLINDTGIVEVKCPFSIRKMSPLDAVKENKITCVYLADNEEIKLKRTHNYFYQIQGQLHISKRAFCDFILWTPLGIAIERIFKDDEFWTNKMEKPLVEFFFKCLLPEIIDPQYPSGRSIKDKRNQ